MERCKTTRGASVQQWGGARGREKSDNSPKRSNYILGLPSYPLWCIISSQNNPQGLSSQTLEDSPLTQREGETGLKSHEHIQYTQYTKSVHISSYVSAVHPLEMLLQQCNCVGPKRTVSFTYRLFQSNLTQAGDLVHNVVHCQHLSQSAYKQTKGHRNAS